MNKKILICCLLLLTAFLPANAQMSDAQVTSYVKARSKAGASSQTIGQELLMRGATTGQIQRLMGQGAVGSAKTSSSSSSSSSSSTSKAETKPDAVTASTDSIQPIEIFGHDIFRSQKLSFEPNSSMAISPTYVVGPGDELIINVYGASQTTQNLKIAADGTVTIPKIGPIGVSGMTVEQAQARVRKAMGGHYQNSSIKVGVGQTRTISINIMGEVMTPGTYTLSAFATVFHALYMAGGVTNMGTLRNVQVARNGRIITTVDVYEYIVSGRLAGNVKLRDNDVIIVGPYENLVQINGKIKRPMWYEMKKNESLLSLIRFSGGFTGDAYNKNITVNRKSGDMYSVYTVEEFDYGSFKLADQDSIFINGNEKRYENMVVLTGAVKRPGNYGLKASGTIKGLLSLAGGLEENAMKNRAVIVRMNEDRTRRTLSVDLAGIMDGTTPDIALQNEDSVVIASMAKMIDDRKLYISGEVWNPGTFSYSENSSVEDLIVMAGGLKESAALLNVEVSRRIVDSSAKEDEDIKSEIFTFNLTKDMNVDNDSKFRLLPYDRVYVHRSPVYDVQKSVKVTGEVMFAGQYALKDNNVRLSDIIKKAGGLKKQASAHNARLMRHMDKFEEARVRQLLDMQMQTSTDGTDVLNLDSLKQEKILKDSVYSVGIDLEMAMAHPGSSYDIVLKDSDEIIIPQPNTTVKISGEVLHPNSVTYIAGKKASYYVNEAGGYTKQAYKRRAYIVYANGHVNKVSKGKVEPGCEIVVPVKTTSSNGASMIMQWVSVASSIATMSAVVLSLVKNL